jgi:hypothetical protein
VSIFALMILRWSTVAFPCVCANALAALGNFSVEVLLPQGGHGLQLSCSGWSVVLGVDADGGTPDLDFAKQGSGRMAARRCPDRLFAVLTGTVSDLFCEADD